MTDEMSRNQYDLVDLVDVALVFAAISLANEVFNQYQSWRDSRGGIQRIREAGDGRALAIMRRTLLRVGDRADVTSRIMDQISLNLANALSLIEPDDREILYQIPFLAGYKGRVRWRDRPRYRQLVKEIHCNLGDLLGLLDEISELVADLIPPQSNEEMLQMARVSAAENKAVKEVLRALSDDDTSLGDAIDLVMKLLDSSRPYLTALRDEAFGETEGIQDDQGITVD